MPLGAAGHLRRPVRRPRRPPHRAIQEPAGVGVAAVLQRRQQRAEPPAASAGHGAAVGLAAARRVSRLRSYSSSGGSARPLACGSSRTRRAAHRLSAIWQMSRMSRPEAPDEAAARRSRSEGRRWCAYRSKTCWRCAVPGSGRATVTSKRESSACGGRGGGRAWARPASRRAAWPSAAGLAAAAAADRVEVVGPVGGGEEDGARVGVEAVELAQQHREGAARGLVHAGAAAAGGESVDLVEEDDRGAQLGARLEDRPARRRPSVRGRGGS